MNISEFARQSGLGWVARKRLERFAELARAEVLEEAAKVCDEAITHEWNIPHKPALVNCAAAIRGLK